VTKRAAHHLVIGLALSVLTGGMSLAADDAPADWRELNDRGTAAAAAEDWSEAESALRAALALLEPEAPGTAATPDDDARIAVVAANLAMVELAQGDTAAARALLERALAIRRAVFGDSEPGIAALLNNLGELERRAGNLDRARQLHEAALVMRRTLREPGHPDIAESLNNLGVTLSDLGQLDTAGGLVQDALAMRRERLGPTHRATLESTANAAAIATEAGDLAAAETLLRAPLEAMVAASGDAHPDAELVAQLWRNLVEVLLLQNADDAALLACEELVADLPPADRQATTDLVTVCVRAFNRVGAEERATRLLEQQLELDEVPRAARLQLRWSLAETAASAGDFEAAHEQIDTVIELLGTATDRRLPLALNNRAYFAFELGRPLDAATDLEAALAAIEALPPPGDAALERDVLNNLASVLRSLDRGDEAAAVEERLLDTVPADAPTDGSGAQPAAGPPPSGD
jgi:tetratricopeptide (TPR) repeat protein